MTSSTGPQHLDPATIAFYRHAMDVLARADVPFLVGGAYAFERYAGIERHTKDFDLFLREADLRRALGALGDAGYVTELTFPHWLGKAFQAGDFVDLIFGSGNGVAPVDEEWFAHATEAEVLGVPARLCPAEEMIWSKSFIMERERYDGADVAHLLRARAEQLRWDRLLRRFEPHPEVLLAHLLLFGFVYPGERERIPAEVIAELLARAQHGPSLNGAAGACRGTLLSRSQYVVDVSRWGYRDARLAPLGRMSAEDVARWTGAGLEELGEG